MTAATQKNIVVIGMGYPSATLRAGVGIPCAALLADVDGFRVTGVQRRSQRSGWKIEHLNAGQSPFEGDEPGLAELIHRVAVEKKSFRVTDDYSTCREADVILIDVQTPTDEDHVPRMADGGWQMGTISDKLPAIERLSRALSAAGDPGHHRVHRRTRHHPARRPAHPGTTVWPRRSRGAGEPSETRRQGEGETRSKGDFLLVSWSPCHPLSPAPLHPSIL